MKAIRIKLRYIFLRYLIVASILITCYSLFLYFFNYKLGILHLKEDLLEYWLPFLLSFAVVGLTLSNPLKILYLPSRGQVLFFLVPSISIIIPTIIAANYLEASLSELMQVNTVKEIQEARNIDCYLINDFNINTNQIGIKSQSRVTGKHNENLVFELFFAAPITDSTTQVNDLNHQYWYVAKAIETISNTGTDARIDREWRTFYDSSLKEFKIRKFDDFQYLQGISYSDDRDGYIAAIKKIQPNNNIKHLILLEPHDDIFAQKVGHKFAWIFISLSIGAIVTLVMFLIPSINYSQFNKYNSQKGLKNDALSTVGYLIPKGDHFITVLLIDINILVYIIAILAGANLISPTPDQLLALGGNRRDEILHGESWRLFTSMFLHGGLIHLISNLASIAIVGILIEVQFGRIKTLIAYLLSGICASIASIFWHENTISVGASGAVFGLMGLMLAALVTRKSGDQGGVYVLVLIFIGGISLIFGLARSVDNVAHIGGLIAGFIIGLLMTPTLPKNKTKVEMF